MESLIILNNQIHSFFFLFKLKEAREALRPLIHHFISQFILKQAYLIDQASTRKNNVSVFSL